MQVPIVWENGKSVIFMMLVVPDLTWPKQGGISFSTNQRIC